MEQIKRQAKWTTNGRSSSREGDAVYIVDWKGVLDYNSFCKIKWFQVPFPIRSSESSTQQKVSKWGIWVEKNIVQTSPLFPNFFITSNGKSVTIKQSFPIPSSSQALVT